MRRWPLVYWYWPALLSVAVGGVVVAGLLRLHQQTDVAEARSQVETQLTLLRARLEATAQTTFTPTLGLEAMIQLDGDITDERFERLIARAVTLAPQLRSVVAAPDDVARHVFPREGNERVFNLDYRSIPAQWAQVQAARSHRGPLLSAPVSLVQGGLGIIQRSPVFLRDAREPNGQRYWGVVSVVADLDRFIRAAGIDGQEQLDLELLEQGPQGGEGRHIWGQSKLATAQPVRQTAQLPGATWVLLGVPSAGWESELAWRSPDVLASAIGAALVTLLLALLGRQRQVLWDRNQALAQEVEVGRLAREQLQESQERFRSMAALASDWVWEQDAELRFTYISRSAEEASSVHSSSVLGHRRWDSPSLAPGFDWEAHKAALERHEPFRNLEYAQYTEDGTLRYVSVSGTPFFDAQGVFRGYRGTGRNISAAKQAEAALKQSQAELLQARDRLQALLDAAIEVAIIATDLQGKVILFNRGAERMLGYSEDELIGKSPAQLHLPAEALARGVELSALLGRTVEGFEVFVALAQRDGVETREWTYLHKDGHDIAVSLSVTHVRARDGSPLGYLGVARDISAQRRAEQESLQLNAELEHRVQERTAELSQALAHLNRAQDELLRSEKLAALGSLVAGVAHELNTPLGNCLTTASTLDERTREIQEAFAQGNMRRSSLESYLQDAGAAAAILLRGLGTANELVSHFKQLSVDQTSVQRRQFQLQSVVNDVLSLMRARWKSTPFRISTDIPFTDELEGYPGPLGQVLSNLMLNALLHAFEGREQGELRIRARLLDEAWFELVVQDDGLGMSDEVRRRAFDPFFTTKMGRGGTGLGLNIVYNIVTGVLGGQVELHSELGQGSRFVFRLPRVAPELKTA